MDALDLAERLGFGIGGGQGSKFSRAFDDVQNCSHSLKNQPMALQTICLNGRQKGKLFRFTWWILTISLFEISLRFHGLRSSDGAPAAAVEKLLKSLERGRGGLVEDQKPQKGSVPTFLKGPLIFMSKWVDPKDAKGLNRCNQ